MSLLINRNEYNIIMKMMHLTKHLKHILFSFGEKFQREMLAVHCDPLLLFIKANQLRKMAM